MLADRAIERHGHREAEDLVLLAQTLLLLAWDLREQIGLLRTEVR